MRHEIRTPNNAVLGAIEVLADEVAESRHREFVETAEQAAEALARRLDNVLDLSKMDEGKMQLKRVPVEIRALGHSSASLLNCELQKRSIDLNVDLQANERWLMFDPTRLRQLLMNLLGNARKFTERRSITLVFDVLEEREGTWPHVVVIDTGCVIAATLQPVIFDPHTQADGSASRHCPGPNRQARNWWLMSGSIELHSDKVGGTSVSLPIPVERSQAAPISAATSTVSSIAPLRGLLEMHALTSRRRVSNATRRVSAASPSNASHTCMRNCGGHPAYSVSQAIITA